MNVNVVCATLRARFIVAFLFFFRHWTATHFRVLASQRFSSNVPVDCFNWRARNAFFFLLLVIRTNIKQLAISRCYYLSLSPPSPLTVTLATTLVVILSILLICSAMKWHDSSLSIKAYFLYSLHFPTVCPFRSISVSLASSLILSHWNVL